MLEKEISKIFKNSSISFEEMIFDYETFEEPLLINYYSCLDKVREYVNKDDLDVFFV